MKKIAILGCGAMGTAMGAYMARNGLFVDMVDSYEAHVKALNEKGAQILGRDAFTTPVKAILPQQMEGIYDLVFLLTKQTANEVVLNALLPHLGPNSVVCTLQNGVPEPFVAQIVGARRTVGGAIQWGATFRGPGVSDVTSDMKTKFEKNMPLFAIGEIDGRISPRIEEIAKVLSYMGRTVITTELMNIRWRKLVYNSCGSGMSAACGSNFGAVLDSPRAMDCLAQVANEVAVCAKAAGIDLGDSLVQRLTNVDACKENFFNVYKSARTGKASMLQDLENGRITEVDMINGYICAVGDQYDIDTPYNDALVSIVHRMETGELPLSISNLQYFPEI